MIVTFRYPTGSPYLAIPFSYGGSPAYKSEMIEQFPYVFLEMPHVFLEMPHVFLEMPYVFLEMPYVFLEIF